ncbi:hypothetical protein DAI22_12g063100 [Oryza sativa Japonica Group]|nr:hypothetical protein DAI22_12g063100 [Oryza sativa Japonica Group]
MKRRKTLNRAASSSSDEPGLGRWTCYHGEEEEEEEKPWLPPADKSSESIREYVAEAARRLPLEEIPEIVDCVGAVGYCFGLADPVTNIILNAVAHLAAGGAEDLPPPPKKRTRRTYSRGWGYISLNSFCGLLAFMKARHYLYLASYDLLLAIELVHHDRRRCLPRPSLLPDDGRMKIALRIAAVQADHPAPDKLVQTMTAQYPSHLLSPIMDKLRGSELLTSHHP